MNLPMHDKSWNAELVVVTFPVSNSKSVEETLSCPQSSYYNLAI